MSELGRILYAAFLLLCVYLSIVYLWPVILIVVVMIWWRIHKFKKTMKDVENMQKEEMDSINETYGTSYNDDLFRSSMDQTSHQGEVIDAKFSEHEDGEI